MPYSNNSFLLSSFLQSSSQTRYLHCANVFILFRDCYEMGHKKIQIWKRYTTKCCPQSQTRKRLDLALELAGVDSLLDAAHNVCRSTSAYKKSAKCREAQTRISQHKTHNRTCTHAQTRRLSRNWTDRTRLATLAPHLTGAKSDTSKGPRSVITSIGIGYTLITYYQ